MKQIEVSRKIFQENAFRLGVSHNRLPLRFRRFDALPHMVGGSY